MKTHALVFLFVLILSASAECQLPQGTFSGSTYSPGDLGKVNITIEVRRLKNSQYKIHKKKGFNYLVSPATYENTPYLTYAGTTKGRLRFKFGSFDCVGYPYLSVRQEPKNPDRVILSQTIYYSPEGVSEIGAGCQDAVDRLTSESVVGILKKIK